MIPFDHVLVPVASERDAETTCAALESFLPHVERVTAVHVIEKGGGAMDKAPLEKRREDAAEILAVVDRRLGDAVPLETEIRYGTDVVATVFETADDVGATAVAFSPRGGSRIVRLLTGDTATRLVTETELPVVSLPSPDEE